MIGERNIMITHRVHYGPVHENIYLVLYVELRNDYSKLVFFSIHNSVPRNTEDIIEPGGCHLFPK